MNRDEAEPLSLTWSIVKPLVLFQNVVSFDDLLLENLPKTAVIHSKFCEIDPL